MSGPSSWAPASPASAPPSSSTSTASPTSSSWRRATPSAAPGGTTPTPAPPATCPASCTPTASRRTRTGRARSRRSPRSRPTSSAPREESGVLDRFRFGVTFEDAAWDEDDQRLDGVSTDHGDVTADVAGHRLRRALGAQAAGDRGHRVLRGRDLPLRPLEPRLRPDRQAGGGDRHRRLRDPDRARDRQAGRPPRPLPAHRPLGDAAPRPRLHQGREARLPLPAVLPEGLPHRHLLGPRVLRAGLHRQPASSPPRPGRWR